MNGIGVRPNDKQLVRLIKATALKGGIPADLPRSNALPTIHSWT
ncbi:hypothetical protein [uncultured Tateyamaria sp.]|nr:hypothetical protein [uncultured Tateyamaria sp.]